MFIVLKIKNILNILTSIFGLCRITVSKRERFFYVFVQ